MGNTIAPPAMVKPPFPTGQEVSIIVCRQAQLGRIAIARTGAADAPRAEGIPIDYCYGDAVVLNLTHKRAGEEITPEDIDEAERKLDGYRIKALDIVLLRTDAAKQRTEKSYLTNHPGMTKEAVHAVLDRGVKVMGIDAIGFDPPVAQMFERRKFWEAHRVMREREYYHLENLCNLHEIPAPYHSFTVSVLPV